MDRVQDPLEVPNIVLQLDAPVEEVVGLCVHVVVEEVQDEVEDVREIEVLP